MVMTHTDDLGDDELLRLVESMFDETRVVPAETKAFVDGLVKESDRGCVLAGTAFMSDELDALLREAFRGPSTAINRLFDGPNPPLGSLWAKSTLATAMGLIDAKTCDTLDTLRKMRNAFAHSSGPVSLSDERLTTLLNTLRAPVRKVVEALGLAFKEAIGEIDSTGRQIAKGQSNSAHEWKAAVPPSSQKIQFLMALLLCHRDIIGSRVRLSSPASRRAARFT